MQERVGNFLAGLAQPEQIRRLKHRPQMRPMLPTAIPRLRQMHIPPWLWFSTQNIFRDGTSRPCGDDPYGETVTLR